MSDLWRRAFAALLGLALGVGALIGAGAVTGRVGAITIDDWWW
jgi:hypothetical protein